VYQLYFEDGYVESAYLTRVAEMSADLPAVFAISAVGERTILDGYYFAEGYIETGYFVYVAQASSSLASSFIVNCNTTFEEFFATLSSTFTQTASGGKLVGFTVELQSTFSQTATATRNADIDLFAFGDAALAAAVSRIRDNNIAASSAFTIAADVTRTRNLSSEEAAVFSAIINGLRSRDTTIETQAAFSLTAIGQRTTDIVLTAFTNGNLTAVASIEKSTGSSLSTTTNITVDAVRSRDVTSTITATTSLSVPGNRTREIQATLVSEYAITAQGQRTTDIVLSAFGNGSLSAVAIANKTLASSQTCSATLTSNAGKANVASANLAAQFRLAGYLNVLVRNYAVTPNTGGIYNTARIDNSVYKFGGGSLTWDETTSAFTDSQPVVSGTSFYIFQEGYTWSSSNGTSWTRTTNNLTVDPNKTSVQVVRENGYFIFLDDNQDLHYSTDGTTWSINTSPFGFTGFRPANSTVHFYNGSYYIFGAYETGANITRVGQASSTTLDGIWSLSYDATGEISRDTYKSGNGVVLGFSQTSNNTNYLTRKLIASPQTGILVSGLTYATIRQVAYDSNNQDYAVIYDNPGNSTKYLTYSTNNGSTWTQPGFTLPETVNDLQYLNGTWFVSTDIGLYTTDLSTLTKVHDYNVSTLLWNGTRFLSTLVDKPGFVVTSTTAGSGWTVSQVDNISGVRASLVYATGSIATNTIDLWVNIDSENSLNDIRRYGSSFLRIRQDADNYLTFTAYTYSSNTYISVQKSYQGSLGSVYLSNTNVSGWAHIRFVQSGSTASLYVNGQRSGGNGSVMTTSSWPSGNINGPVELLQRDPLYVDELLITEDLLNSPTLTSITVPTARWDNTANTKLLLHFNDSFVDDSRFQVIPQANITATATLSVTPRVDYIETISLTSTSTLTVIGSRSSDIDLVAFSNGSLTANNARTRSNASSQSATFALTANNTRTRAIDSALSATSSINAANTRTRAFDSSISALTSTLVLAQEDSGLSAALTATFNTTQRYIEDGTFETGYFATSDINAVKTASGSATLNSQFTVSADSDYLTNFSASLTSQSSLTASISVVRSAAGALSSTSTVTVNAARFTNTAIPMAAAFDLTAIGIKGSEIALFAFSNGTLTADVKRTRSTSSSLSSTATLYVDTANSLNKLADSHLSAEFTQTANNTRTRSTSVSMSAFTVEVVVGDKQTTNTIALTATFTQTAINARTRSSSTALTAQSTVQATAKKTAVGTVAISAAMNAVMVVREIRLDTIVYRIPAEGWIYNITAEERSYAINGETRVFRMKSETRVRNIAEETRILTIN
jgi:hypothetical protein